MSTILSAETNALIKLDLADKGGTRRIVFSRLWNPETCQVSFDQLSKLAFEYCTLARPKLNVANITYIDVDGDTITISTDNELTEAFEQFAVQFPNAQIVLRAKATFKNVRRGGVEHMGRCVNVRKWASLQVVLDSFVTDMTDIAQVHHAPDLFVQKMGATIEKFSKSVELMRPKKADDVVNVDATTNHTGKPSGRGKGRMNMKTLLDSFVKNMTKVVEGQPAPDMLIAKMTNAIEMLSSDIELMRLRPQKMDDMGVTNIETLEAECLADTNGALGKGRESTTAALVAPPVGSANLLHPPSPRMKRGSLRNKCNGRKRAKMQLLDSFLMNMTGITDILKEQAKNNTEEVVANEVDGMAISSDNDGAGGWEAVP